MIGVVSLAFIIASVQIATPANAEDTPTPPPGVTSTVATDSGASSDTTAIADAADDYQASDPASAADLADAASATNAVPLTKTKNGLTASTEDGATITVAKDGDVTLSAPGTPEIGISVAGEADTTKVVDGALVQTEVAPSTDIVTRATEDGVQAVAVLANENAPSELKFPVDLPAHSELVPQPDGSVAVLVEAEVETVSEAEADRVSAAAADVLGPDFDGTPTDAQIEALDAIPAPATYTAKKLVQVGVIGAPWAVDANGEPLDTHFEVGDSGIVQFINTDGETAYPVTADPWFSFLPGAIQSLINVVKMLVVSNNVFAAALGAWVKAKTLKSQGRCRLESSYGINVCWGGKLQWMVGGGGTTYGTTFLFKGSVDPRAVTPYTDSAKYQGLLRHEAEHMKQWRALGPAFVSVYVGGMGVSLYRTGNYACGNIWEMMAGFKDGGYEYC